MRYWLAHEGIHNIKVVNRPVIYHLKTLYLYIIMRGVCVYILLIASLAANAQGQPEPSRKFVVADMETRVPIRNVIVAWGKNGRDTTNYRGVCHIPDKFDTLTVYKANYLTERLSYREVKDTTFLLSNHNRINEVTIWGKDRERELQDNVNDWTRQRNAPPSNSGGLIVVTFDMARLLDKRYQRDQKRLQKVRSTFNQMDKYDDDPIVNAYKKELEERRLAAERAKNLEEQKKKSRQEGQKAIEEKKRQTEKTATRLER